MRPFKLEEKSLTTEEFSALFKTLIRDLEKSDCDYDVVDLSGLRIITKETTVNNNKITESRSLSDEECERLANALRRNKTVEKLNLMNCEISSQGLKNIAKLFEGRDGNKIIEQVNVKGKHSDLVATRKNIEQSTNAIKEILEKIDKLSKNYPEFSKISKVSGAGAQRDLEVQIKVLTETIDQFNKNISGKVSVDERNIFQEQINHFKKILKVSEKMYKQITSLVKKNQDSMLKERQMERDVVKNQRTIYQSAQRNSAEKGDNRNERQAQETVRLASEQKARQEIENRQRALDLSELNAIRQSVTRRTREAKGQLSAFEIARHKRDERLHTSEQNALNNSLERIERGGGTAFVPKNKQQIEREKVQFSRNLSMQHGTERKEAKERLIARTYGHVGQEEQEFGKIKDKLLIELQVYIQGKDKELSQLQKKTKQAKTTVTLGGTDLMKKIRLAKRIMESLQYDKAGDLKPIEALFPKGQNQVIQFLKNMQEEDKKLRVDTGNVYHAHVKGDLGKILTKYEKKFNDVNLDIEPPKNIR